MSDATDKALNLALSYFEERRETLLSLVHDGNPDNPAAGDALDRIEYLIAQCRTGSRRGRTEDE